MKSRFAKLEAAYEANGYKLDTVFYDVDNEDVETKKILKKFQIDVSEATIPQFIFLDKNGKESKRLTGEITQQDLIKNIHETLKKEGLNPPDLNTNQKPWWRFWL